MKVKENIKKIVSVYNPIAINRRRRMRKALKQTDISFICPNCIGGILFHDLKLRFLSPTVNTMMYQEDCAKYLLNLDHYSKQNLRFYKDEEYDCPCAFLDDIKIHFIHYHTEEDAERCWYERTKRINPNNIFAFFMERDSLDYTLIKRLGSLNIKGLVVFTAHEYPDLPYCVFLKKYQEVGEVGNILHKYYFDDSREYEKFFDFINWFNKANGQPYDVTSSIRKR